MNLGEIQKQEIADHIKGIAAYAETYNELYDHVLSAVSSEEHDTFSMDVVANIINEDFGGIKKIKLEEENHQKELFNSFFSLFKREMLDIFKFPAVIGNLAILVVCYWIYSGEATEETKTKVLLASLFILMLTPLFLYLVKVYIIDRNLVKPSKTNPVLRSTAMFQMNFAYAVFIMFLQSDAVFGLSSGTKYLIILCIYFFLGVYVRSYLKIYNNALKLKLQ